jgi:hypothetical protein
MSSALLLQQRPGLGSLVLLVADNEVVGVDGDALSAVLGLVDADQVVGELEHIVPKTNDDELRVPAPHPHALGLHEPTEPTAAEQTKGLQDRNSAAEMARGN